MAIPFSTVMNRQETGFMIVYDTLSPKQINRTGHLTVSVSLIVIRDILFSLYTHWALYDLNGKCWTVGQVFTIH